ncbi:MAG: DUF3052 domain-containing protein [Boseongicola sp. SB0673_bin_14]|nr:DUF3052 domain-containing protein [Chloroflexota bacterium]MYI70702.1 DUF3052 domain-containing protein [Boseongicola sp. SB0673_bin_14]
MTAGYSGTPLVKKLGIKGGVRAALIHAPADYLDLLGDLPADAVIDCELAGVSYDFVQAFYVWRADYEADFPRLKAAIHRDGMVWISWYKKTARMSTDITEDVVREVALAGGLVDVKVAAIDAQWSGLKLVYRRSDR